MSQDFSGLAFHISISRGGELTDFRNKCGVPVIYIPYAKMIPQLQYYNLSGPSGATGASPGDYFLQILFFLAKTLDNYYQCLYLINVSVLKNPEHTNLPRLISTLFHHFRRLMGQVLPVAG